ncbi:MAG: DUF2007 domain-containing protein [Nitrospirae bacterium]|nr:MAG: DUF2007 domain-containing protein [Nitrospirota bacterium]
MPVRNVESRLPKRHSAPLGIAFQRAASYNVAVKKLLAPGDENELIILTSLLESDGIAYHIRNEHFGSLYPGLNLFPWNERMIYVNEADYARASLIARDFLDAVRRSVRSLDRTEELSTIQPPGGSPQKTDSGA